MEIWDKSPRTVLNVLIGSTAHKYYFSEIQTLTGLWPSVLTTTLQRLTNAEVLIREEEGYVGESDFRAPRVYYRINPDVIDWLRLPNAD